jgi:glycosyltransferase involved in cell wall biosynthesis
VSVRRLVRRTGLDRLLDAMPGIAHAVPGAHLYIGGTGPLRSALEARVRSLGLGRQVTFLGYVPDDRLPIVYRAAEINVLPTIALEGFGLTAAEALAVGTPSMVTPIGALPEVVSPLSPALVFASASTADIAAGLTAALNGATRLPDAEACRAYARARFAADTMARRVAAVYREVC